MSGAIGAPFERHDARAKVMGRARYTTDLAIPGMVEGKVLRSPYPHARILTIETGDAERLPGVVAVLTAADLADIDPYFGQAIRDQPLLAIDRVRWAGEPVVAVAAVDARTAEAALGRIAVRYEPLPPVRSIDEALAPGAPVLHEARPRSTLFPDVQDVAPDLARNICHHFAYRRGDPEAAFREADLVFDDTFTLPSVHHHPLEPHGAIAHHQGRQLTVWAGTQYPFATRQMLAEMFRLPQSRVRVVVPDVGGAFGSRELMAVIPLAAALSRKAWAPVRVLYSAEETARTLCRNAARVRIQTAVRRDGTLLGRRGEIHLDAGAYANQEPRMAKKAGYRLVGPYRVPHVEVHAYAVFTNSVSAGAYRGFGTPEVAWAYESQMDAIALALGMDPVALRRKNLLQRGEEYAPGDRPVDSDLGAALEALVSRLPGASGRGRAVGVACAIKDGGGTRTSSTAIVRLHGDGSATVLASSAELGQGIQSVLARIAAAELGIPPGQVAVTAPDTGVTPFDQRTNASRGTALLGHAVQAAARQVADQARAIAAEALGVAVEACRLEDGAVRAGDRRLTLGEVIVRFFRDAGGELIGHGYYRPAAERATLGARASFWEIGLGAAEVSVDRETGALTVHRYVTVSDPGRALDPDGVEGQDLGGVVMGLGPALFEALVYEDGQLVNGSIVDYRLPLFSDLPDSLEAVIVEGGGGPGPHGAKGVAEGSIVPVAPAIANAVAAATGVRIRDLPLTPERVWRALRAAKA
ncbi:MAG TPA: xanthine dehydrogenase family protein molybdopterin-binding subunit [Methylomirabilota bacterium]|nr:xanthine dehydrogenase family protein molybdopterin-binding subunit [Methylomirabilota bacterium]